MLSVCPYLFEGVLIARACLKFMCVRVSEVGVAILQVDDVQKRQERELTHLATVQAGGWPRVTAGAGCCCDGGRLWHARSAVRCGAMEPGWRIMPR